MAKESRALSIRPLGDLSRGSRVLATRVPRVEKLRPLEAEDCPPVLSDAARLEWARLLADPSLAERLASLDRNVLAIYCQAWGRCWEAEAQVRELGLIVKGPTGEPMTNPYLAVVNQSIKQLSELGRQLGLSPAARKQIRGS